MAEASEGSRERVAYDLCMNLKSDLSTGSGKEHIEQVLKLYSAARRCVFTGDVDVSKIT